MMNRNTKNEMNVHLVPEKIRFSMFTTEEVKNMCVTKIVTPLMMDALGHPLSGGLYDSKLGPLSDRSGTLCGTCKKTMSICPGHFGYIELPLPVVNPIFHSIIGTLIKTSCLSCYQIQIPMHIKRCITIQIKLLNCGLLTPAMEVGSQIKELISLYDSFENIPENMILPILEYERLANDTLAKLGNFVTSQNIEAIRNQMVNEMLRKIATRLSCLYCKATMEKRQTLKNKIILSTRKSARKRNSEGVTEIESQYVSPEESRQYMRKIYEANKDFIQQLVSVLTDIKLEHPTDVFYFDVIPVPPPNVRPVNIIMDRMIENKQTQIYKTILQDVILLRTIIQMERQKGDENSLTSIEAKQAYGLARGETAVEKLNFAWEELQNNVNALVDKESSNSKESEGLKQIIEKKQGIVRMNMMGKRVNFSARSVITPDPNLNIEEIGVPEEFAKRLTYPVAVTPWNVEELRKMILNGPNVHPGAVMVEYNGTVKRINPNNETQQKSILKCLLTPDDKEKGFQTVKIVHRHLCNGDVLLLNRQPTLHKPSIMAHTARILKGEKTLRLHYANCKAYNADFDGDEMNAHFPQNELARSEGYNIVNVSNQYLVPKDGTPLSGLIQDHMIAGVRMSVRGMFFAKDDYQQLVYQALAFKTGPITLLPPAIIKPARLWSGKQILSTVLINIIPDGRIPINLTSTSKISSKAWQSVTPRRWKAGGTPFSDSNTMSEAEVIIRNGEVLVGILDKTHYGATPYGLIHCMNELYGGTYATRLLSSFAKLFMRFLQHEGFTLGVHDILTVSRADRKRKEIIENSRKIGTDVITSALNLPKDMPTEEIVESIEDAVAADPKIRAVIDRHYKSALDSYTNDINRVCLPAGLVCKFPHNNLQLMVQSGAKGSTVNTMQISCLLGQIELEGKRPPVMISGKSLPSFPVFEFTPRAGGFIDGRFMTGIQPQEFFFHCMAGREGLIDTAVKTSRSGYLQRCLIKHLEGLHVGYDMTVRNSDKSVIQFLYGEDGLDISKAQFLNEKQRSFLADNTKALVQEEILKEFKHGEDQQLIKSHQNDILAWIEKNGGPLEKRRRSPFALFSKYVQDRLNQNFEKSKIAKLWYNADKDIQENFQDLCKGCPDPLNSIFQPDSHFGSINERLEKLISDYDGPKKNKFRNMMKLKVMQSMCSPGEPVGLLAAQSIGEPSTQMTLNTFHFAGRGEMNVTLGIPRLREILMMASKQIKTPSMEIPFKDVPNLEEKADKLRKMLARVTVADVLEKIDVTIELQLRPKRQYRYIVKTYFLPEECYSQDYCVTPRKILAYIEKNFIGEFFTAVSKFSKMTSNVSAMEEGKEKRRPARGGKDDDEDDDQGKGNAGPAQDQSSSEDEVEDEEDAKTTSKFQQTHEDQEPEDDEIEALDLDNDDIETIAESTENQEEEVEDEENETEGKEGKAKGKETENQEEVEDEENETEGKEGKAKRKEKEGKAKGKGKGKVEQKSPLQAYLDKYKYGKHYVKDTENHLWCEFSFELPLKFKKLDMTALLKEVSAKSVVWQVPNINRAITYMKDDKLMLRTDGINIVEIFKFHELLDMQKLYCNDIHKVAETYGIEAASRIIVKEVKDVFNVYGIKVDPRHLSLIADYMTYNGTFEPLSRKGMESSASPLQQISFEASLGFLRNALIRGKQDDLQNPSSALMIGKPCGTGTGCFSLIHKFPSLKIVN